MTIFSDGCGGFFDDWNGDDDPQDPEARPRITMTAAEFMRLYPMQPKSEEESNAT
jgi:hypothetical protein